MKDLIARARSYAERMPTGLIDPRAVEKLHAEEAELEEEIAAGRYEDALTELADVAYYAAKAVLNGLINEMMAYATINVAAARIGCDVVDAKIAMCAKYDLRATGIKDKDAERAAVVAALS